MIFCANRGYKYLTEVKSETSNSHQFLNNLCIRYFTDTAAFFVSTQVRQRIVKDYQFDLT